MPRCQISAALATSRRNDRAAVQQLLAGVGAVEGRDRVEFLFGENARIGECGLAFRDRRARPPAPASSRRRSRRSVPAGRDSAGSAAASALSPPRQDIVVRVGRMDRGDRRPRGLRCAPRSPGQSLASRLPRRPQSPARLRLGERWCTKCHDWKNSLFLLSSASMVLTPLVARYDRQHAPARERGRARRRPEWHEEQSTALLYPECGQKMHRG